MFRSFSFTSRSTANLVTVTANRIARVLNASGAIHAIVLDVSKDSYRVWHDGILYKFSFITCRYEKLVCLIESFCNGKKLNYFKAQVIF